MPDLTGQLLNDYQVLRRLGRGAMAEVYLAEQRSLSRQVALKVLNEELAQDESYVTRFQHEARSAAALVHANIVQVYEVGRSNSSHYIAQEYVPGSNLGELVQQQGRLKPGLVLDIMRQAASALHKAYEGGIVHRDIKPENLMLARSGEVKVADFGLARVATPSTSQLTQVGVTMGTPLYMSPEQIEGKQVDVRSDLYSLGVTVYHLLSGEPPFKADTPLGVAVQHLNNHAPPVTDVVPDLPVRLSQVVDKLMAKKPGARYQTPGELLADLRDLAKQAATEGWAEGPENWSAHDLAALREPMQHATAELDTLMKQATSIRANQRPWGRRALLLAGCLLVGALLGGISRPEPLLADAETAVPPQASVLGQIYYAKRIDTPEAWLAVSKYFKDIDPSHEIMADQGLVRYYLKHENHDQARTVSLDLIAKAGNTHPEARQFAAAALTVSLVRLEDYDQARRALSTWFDPIYVDELRQLEPLVGQMFDEAIDTLDQAP